MFDLKKSPIRENVNGLKEGQLSIFEDDDLSMEQDSHYQKLQVGTILKDVENMLDTMERNQHKDVRIAVMGEVKAGKSTFVNVCVGKEVAYTDILEATAVVSEITFSEEEYVHVFDRSGKIAKDLTTEELLAWTEDQIENEADFSQFDRIEIGINSEFLRGIILVDTPGLLSVTSQNHDVTNQYVAQTDYILWVINSRDLGSKAVNDYIDKIRLSGKPIVGIINKVDSEEECESIKGTIEKEYGNVFEDIFFVSSANAWDYMTDGEAGWEQKTGFSDVLECIGDLCEDRGHSTKNTQYYQLQREREVHLKMRERIQKRKEYYDSELAQFAHINLEMKKVIHKELENWIHMELYMDEKTNLMNANVRGKDFHDLYDKYSDAAYLTDVINNKYQEITGFIHKKWEVIENSLVENTSEVLIDFQYDKSIVSDIGEEEVTDAVALSEEGVKAGLKGGVMMGLVFAGYSAWLGPAAATVTFASALPCVLPLAIGGAILGSYLGKRNVNTEEIQRNAQKKEEAVKQLCDSVKKTVASQKAELEKTLYACSNYYYKERCNLYKEKADLFHFDFTQPRYREFCQQLDEYINSLDREIDRLGYDDIPKPPSMKEMEEA